MKKFLGVVLALAITTSIAYGAITANSPVRSPMLGSIGESVMVDSGSRRLPVMAVVQPDSSGVTGLSDTYFVKGKVSSVTGLEEAPQYKLANGKTVPVYALAKLDTSGRTIAPFAVSSGGILSLNAQAGSAQVYANDTNVIITSSANTHSLGWAGTLSAARGGLGMGVQAAGRILYSNGSAWVALPAGTAGQVLTSGGAAAPTWQ